VDASPLSINSRLLDGIRILAVDDEADTRDFLQFALEQRGAVVQTVDSASSALAQLERFHPDLLISDIEMPEENGYKLLQRIRQLGTQQSQIPAIALTAHAQSKDRDQALQVGFQQHLTKPIAPDILITTIAKLIGIAESRYELAP
jgi:hypothetical protein